MNRVFVSMSLLCWSLTCACQAAADAPIDFDRHIRPIFAAHCHSCHGGEHREGGLRLDRKQPALAGGDSGQAIIPGESDKSQLIQYVAGTSDDGLVMPLESEPLTDEQVALLRVWIDQGAVWPDDDADAAPIRSDHWAFQSPRRPALPKVQDPAWTRNAIDRFILAKLEQDELRPSPPADRVTLLRRLHFDLLGLPPTIEEVERFINDRRPDAYERLVDRLLASPAFGERWGRHWLDLARYADSNGYEDDRPRPDAWRFRDWVIDAYNRDLPFDEFTIWQLAGDLLPEAAYEQKVAAGFHRMTLSNEGGADVVEEEFRILAVKDRVNTTGSVWLGLSVGCAQCHSHKYDPITQREYYQLFAFFNRVEDVSIPAPPLPGRYQRQYEQALDEFNQRRARAQQALEEFEADVLPDRLAAWAEQAAVDQALPIEIAKLLAIDPAERTEEQQQELADYYRQTDAEYARIALAARRAKESGNNRPPPPSTKAMTVAYTPRPSHVHLRGNFRQLGEKVAPDAPAFLPPLSARAKEADRLDLARWIVDRENPLTARVAINHIWRRLFGRGLVATPDNFGAQGARPSHPELLDWLATEYVERSFRRKAMIRLMVTSTTYRQSSRRREDLQAADPENRLLARQARFRVEAESVRDAALAVSGLLNRQIGGPSFQPPLPESLLSIEELKNERFMEPSEGPDAYRRGVYINVQRMFMLPMLQTFDVADANASCPRRDRSNTPLQALTLWNDPVFVEAARALGRRILLESHGDPAERIRSAFRLCLARQPNEDEVETLKELWARSRFLYTQHPQLADALTASLDLPQDISSAEAAAWASVARTLLNLDEFITRE